jgi:hypothetical protein
MFGKESFMMAGWMVNDGYIYIYSMYLQTAQTNGLEIKWNIMPCKCS